MDFTNIRNIRSYSASSDIHSSPLGKRQACAAVCLSIAGNFIKSFMTLEIALRNFSLGFLQESLRFTVLRCSRRRPLVLKFELSQLKTRKCLRHCTSATRHLKKGTTSRKITYRRCRPSFQQRRNLRPMRPNRLFVADSFTLCRSHPRRLSHAPAKIARYLLDNKCQQDRVGAEFETENGR
jgi:hypothetical protein